MTRRANRAWLRAGSTVPLALLLAACADGAARSAAAGFCAAHPVGAPFADAVAAARHAGEAHLRQLEENRVVVGFSAMLYSRHLCEIRAAQGRVTAAATFHMD